MDINFRRMEFEDIEATIALCDECFLEHTDLEYAKKVFKENESDENQIYIIGSYENKVVAHLKINIIPTIYESMNTYAILNHVCVHPEYRRHKIGTALLDEAFKICKEKNCKVVELWSKNFRIAAHGLYKKYGFEVLDAKFFSKNVE